MSHTGRQFIIAFCLCLAVFVCLNFESYFLLSTPTYQSIGFPFTFWKHWKDYTRFRVVRFMMDLGLALFCSYKAGSWWSLHCWRKANGDNMA